MAQQTQQAAIGIDIGSWRSVIAVAKRGGVQVITNQANFRQTPSVVGYGPNQRFIGESGNVKMKTNFRDTISYPTRFLGLQNDYPFLREQTKFVPAKSVKGDHGKLLFQVNYQGQNESLVAQQVVGAYLNKLKNIININKLANNQAVLSVPSYFTQIQRKALLDAAKIAQLNVTRLFNESTAVALDYGIFRKNDLDPKIQRNILFVDFGHSKFSTFVCAFTKEKMTTLAQHHQRYLGCRDIDYILLKFYQQVFQKSSGGLDVFESKKAIVKLMENIQKQRKILSANIEHTLNLEYLMEQNDLNYTLTRQQLQKLAEPVFNKIALALRKIKAQIEQKKINIHSIEMVGGGTRIPAFQKIVQSIFNIEPSRTLNSSESIAKGCALMAAIKSPLFRVADYGLQQINYYPIRIFWNFAHNHHHLITKQNEYPQKQTNLLFPAGAILPVTKTLKFNKKQPIQILLAYDPVVQGFGRHISYYRSPAPNPKENDFSIVFKIKINENGLIGLQQLFLQEQYTQQQKIPKKKEQKKESKAAQDKKPQQASKQTPKQQFEVKQIKKTKQNPLKSEQTILVQKNTHKQVQTYFELEAKMMSQDKIIFETYERKNELQSLIYNNREKLNSIYKDFVNPADVPKILKALEDANDWLYNEGQNSSRGIYISKIDSLKPLLEPIWKRYSNFQEIRTTFITAVKTLELNTNLLNSNQQKYNHITVQERQAGIIEIDKIKQVLINTQNLQKTIPKWEKPAISANQLNKFINELNQKIKKIMSKPLPQPPKAQQKPVQEASKTDIPNSNPAGGQQKRSSGQNTKMEEQKTAETKQKMEIQE